MTSLVACFILGKVYFRTYKRLYACGLKENAYFNKTINQFIAMKKVYVLWNNIINTRINTLKALNFGNRHNVEIKILKKFLKK